MFSLLLSISSAYVINQNGYQMVTLATNETLNFAIESKKLSAYLIFDMSISNNLMISVKNGEEKLFSASKSTFSFSSSEDFQIRNLRKFPVYVSIYIIPSDLCDSAMFYTGIPTVNHTYSTSKNRICVFTPNSNQLEEIKTEFLSGRGKVNLYTFPLDQSLNISNDSQLTTRTTTPFFHVITKESGTAKIHFNKIHSGGVEMIWSRCISHEFGSVSSKGFSPSTTQIDQPLCFKPWQSRGFSREASDIVGTVVPVAIFGILLPILTIYGVLAPVYSAYRKIFPKKTQESVNIDNTSNDKSENHESTDSPLIKENISEIEESSSSQSSTSSISTSNIDETSTI
ncbi:hypothetical protein TRFO_03154 [Tritrichomonas foetus]|uniref:Uncharacterized protein n=1 Tax=Tritrichomonas foetus TaxID=1144522 RepID=A0A1J4KWN4_9EUKA|nr:hypothetical protein TRFO_03154 [Tritrichomonas foetus]|eukprot:OHT14124.1 hypothetical protein TRFO_03154 [Tritrichomonas foetus]